jgi:hypothetical protein
VSPCGPSSSIELRPASVDIATAVPISTIAGVVRM